MPAPASKPPADCRFCLGNHILEGEVLAESSGAFMIEVSSSPGNYLLIPKDHIEELTDLPDNWWIEIKQLLPKVPNLSKNYNIALNYGEAAGQRVKHLHFWVIGRTAGQPSSGKGLALLVKEANEAKSAAE